jgi:hypothetical protein
METLERLAVLVGGYPRWAQIFFFVLFLQIVGGAVVFVIYFRDAQLAVNGGTVTVKEPCFKHASHPAHPHD